MDTISSTSGKGDAQKIINILGNVGIPQTLSREKLPSGKENRGRGLGIGRGEIPRSSLLGGIRVITVESVNSPGRDKMKNKRPV